MTLSELKKGESARIISIGGSGSLRQHFLDMGLIPGKSITFMKAAPMGDPIEYRVWGYELTLRLADAEKIQVVKVTEDNSSAAEEISELLQCPHAEHPGLGEMGKYHVESKGGALPEGTLLTFGLAGNQNCGKTTLFNQLTGSNQHVGNFPGVTVDRKDGQIRRFKDTLVTDLPGIYSMSPYTNEEIVTREFFLENKPKGIINIVDATNIERNLYLTLQLIELNIPMVLALNMMDEVRDNGGTIHINELEATLGIPVIPISASRNEGIEELVDHAVHVAKYQECPGRMDFCDAEGTDGGALHRAIHSIMHMIEDHAKAADIPVRFAASKLIEGDQLILEKLKLDQNEQELLEHIIVQMESESGMDRNAALANMRFTFIDRVCSATVVRPGESREHLRSQAMDKLLTGKFTAIPSFAGIMALIFWLTFGLIGPWLSDLMEKGIDWLTVLCDKGLSAAQVNDVIHSLIIDGVFAGVGSVLSFLPTIVTLFFFLSFLEDSGYMARVAFVMDKLLRKLGLSGRSFVPMIIGFGCTVPAIMATRTLPSERDRKMTILLTPFMSCSAKLPVYGLLTAAFFPGHGAIVIIALYFTGIITAILFAILLDRTKFKGEPVPFVMELPNYRFPGLKSVGRLIWDKAKDFITRAFTVIFVATIIIWFLQTFSTHLNVVSDSHDSILALLGGFIAPVFAPLGFGDWRVSTALITGFTAKESVVSTMTVLLGGDTSLLQAMFTPFTAVVFLVFTLLYTPCVAAVSAVKRELGGKWALVVVLLQCVIAWIVAFVVHGAGVLLGF
ncbi:ferrous iron transport protein B [Ihubacter sp. mB4P-1]|uniref:ferrous iron transport protein B n=1 Tax=Ihubacter sp. mB4P-1 TaxID=3242370 RepID=UPI003C7D6195